MTSYAVASNICQALGAGASGFVITCAFNREKSATKEALELLRPHLPRNLAAAPHGRGGQILPATSSNHLNPRFLS